MVSVVSFQNTKSYEDADRESLNPGNLEMPLDRLMNLTVRAVVGLTLHNHIQDAYTVLFAGSSPEVTLERSGDWSKSISSLEFSHTDLMDADPLGRYSGTGQKSRLRSTWNGDDGVM